ncbi:MAG: septal ring lytic transglycosylase RlpA family protein [Actinomycetota bacterium]|nr:septal ring lytic transglycosylase RlpA family protein [Actinomycetota bacterium]
MSISKVFDRLAKHFLAWLFASILILGISFPTNIHAQPLSESALQKFEQKAAIEKEIVALENELAKAKERSALMSQKLAILEEEIRNTYDRVEETKSKIEEVRKELNYKLRLLYINGRQENLAKFLGSRDFVEFLERTELLFDITATSAEKLGDLKGKKEKLEQYQAQLLEQQKEAVRLARSADTLAIEAKIQQKKAELAMVAGEIISMEPPQRESAIPTAFNATRIFEMPDESGFVSTGQVFSGYSSWYGNQFHGRRTASGEVFDQYAFTCAHKTLPFGTWLRVTFNGRSVVVKVNDRGPFVKGRILDLSRGAAEAIGLTGVQWVQCEILAPR